MRHKTIASTIDQMKLLTSFHFPAEQSIMQQLIKVRHRTSADNFSRVRNFQQQFKQFITVGGKAMQLRAALI